MTGDHDTAGGDRPAVILDCDPGHDDAIAIIVAARHTALRGLTTVAGNAPLERTTHNALVMRELLGVDVPVHSGRARPLVAEPRPAEFIHGESGLDGADLPSPTQPADGTDAVEFIVETCRAEAGIWIVPTGPLTNIALALHKDPSIVPLVEEVVIMGGSITEGNVTAVAEANIYNDPEAAQAVFQAGWKVTMVGLDVTHQTNFGGEHLERLARTSGRVTDFARRVMRFLVDLAADFGAEGTPMHDPLAIGVAIDPSFVRTRHMRVDVETRGEFTRGQTVANRHNFVERNEPEGDRLKMTGIDRVEPNAHVAVEVEAERFLSFFIERIAGR